MRIRFWGVRGSTPTPQAENLRYGGNTPCLELRSNSGSLLIVDCGSGLRMLGIGLAAAAVTYLIGRLIGVSVAG